MNITNKTQINFSSVLVLNETEIRALDALIGYGIDPFLKTFYEHMGQHYLKPHEAGLRSLFEAIQKQVRPEMYQINQVRQYLATYGKEKHQ